jgi:dynein heavy chain
VVDQVGALAVIDVHARDVMSKLMNAHTSSIDDFLWQSQVSHRFAYVFVDSDLDSRLQLRYYWESDDLWAMMVSAKRPYGYEYLGNSFRLVSHTRARLA